MGLRAGLGYTSSKFYKYPINGLKRITQMFVSLRYSSKTQDSF